MIDGSGKRQSALAEPGTPEGADNPPNDRRLRVASFSKRLQVAGDETRLLSFSRTVDRARFDHVVIVAVADDDERNSRIGPMLERYRDAGVNVKVFDLELNGVKDTLNYARLFIGLVRLFREQHIDVLDARLSLPTVIGGVAARVAGVPVVVSTQYYPSAWRPPVLWLVGQFAFATLIDAFVSDADNTMELFDRWRLSLRARFMMIPNGVLPAVPQAGREDVKARLGLPTDPEIKIVGQVSRMIPRKGYETFIQAAARVAAARPNTAFLCCGFAEDPAYRTALKELAAREGIGTRLFLADYAGPIGDVMGAIDVFTHLSNEDSSPIAFHESMSASLPAVVTTLPGNKELFEDGVTALAVPVDDVSATTSAILTLLDNSELATRLGVNARARYLARHTPERMARDHERLFVELFLQRSQMLARRPWRRWTKP